MNFPHTCACGGTPQFQKFNNQSGEYPYVFNYKCKKCGAESTKTVSPAEAIRKWNITKGKQFSRELMKSMKDGEPCFASIFGGQEWKK